MLSSFALLLQLASAAFAATVIGPVADLHVVNKQIAPDGFQRNAVVVGDTAAAATFPAPLIKAKKGDLFSLNVHDELTDASMNTSTSIHWHGIFQRHTNWADGPAMVTQCPIVTGNDFKYEFTVPDQAGTYWYHSHLGLQYCDGLRGPIVIYDPSDPVRSMYDIDDENTVITLADWYHDRAADVAARGPPFLSDATLINGKGRSQQTPTADLAVVPVQQNKKYRFRLVSMACDANFIFSIDGHNLTVIEADGELTKPLTVNQIQIYAAQRYSFVLEANQPVSNYWIRAQPDAVSAVDNSFTNGLNSAILRYDGAPASDPTTSAPSDIVALQETALHPYSNPAAPGTPTPGAADVNQPLALSFNPSTGRFFVNDVSFADPPLPVLLQILSGVQTAQSLLPSGSVYTLPKNKVVELTLMGGNALGDPHPFHLHGHTFSVVQSAGQGFNFVDPVRRDTTVVNQNQNTTIRFVTDNSGPWFLHCHIDFHLNTGLAVVMAEDPEGTSLNNPVPPAWNELCKAYNATAEGDR